MLSKYYVDECFVNTSIAHTPNQTAQGLPFVLESCGHIKADERYFTERSGLKSFLLFYTISGTGVMKFRNREVEVVANSCMVIDCKDYHYYGTAKGCNWEFFYFHFKGICAKSYFDIVNGKSLEIVDVNRNKVINELFQEIFESSSRSAELVDIKLSLSISKIFTLLIEEKQSFRKNQLLRHKEDIEASREFVDNNYANEIDIESLAHRVNISKFYFIKLFKSLEGQTPYDYLIDTRINASKKLLFETEKSVNEISLEVGFSDVNNFIKTFKKRTGTTPLKFRRHWMN